jgi:hypothetical protein
VSSFRDQVPTQIVVPCEYTDAVVSVPLVIDAGPVRVVAPSLNQIQGALARGSADVIRNQCELWTRWLLRCEAAQ